VNIVALIKQVPDTETQIKIAPDKKNIIKDDIKWIMNPYDEFGVEEALRIKEKFGGEVTVVGLGPKRVTEALRTALAMGADKAVLISDDALEGSDSIATAKALAAALKEIPFDIVFTGQRGIDDDMGVVGAMVADMLGIPHISLGIKVEVLKDENKVRVNRPIEGQTVVIEAPMPVLITAQKGLNEPRYASLPGIMKAKKKPLAEKKLSDLGLDPKDFGEASRKLKILELSPPPERKAGTKVEGETSQEKAANLAKLLHEEAKVI